MADFHRATYSADADRRFVDLPWEHYKRILDRMQAWAQSHHVHRRWLAAPADTLLHTRSNTPTSPAHAEHRTRKWASCVVLAVGFQSNFRTLPSCGPTVPQPWLNLEAAITQIDLKLTPQMLSRTHHDIARQPGSKPTLVWLDSLWI